MIILLITTKIFNSHKKIKRHLQIFAHGYDSVEVCIDCSHEVWSDGLCMIGHENPAFEKCCNRTRPSKKTPEGNGAGAPALLHPPLGVGHMCVTIQPAHCAIQEHLPFDGVNDLGHEPASLILIPGYFSIYLSRVQAVNFASCICIFH